MPPKQAFSGSKRFSHSFDEQILDLRSSVTAIHHYQGGTREQQANAFLTISLLQQPGPKRFKLSKIELICKAKKFKVPPFTI